MTEIERAVAEFASRLASGSRVLDVGCGLRPYESYFKHGTYVGIDVYESGREAEGKLADYAFDGINIPLDDGSFDAVICTEVLEHAIDPTHLLAEMARVLKPKGKLLVTVPFMWGLHELPYDFRRFTVIGIEKEITQAGFKVQLVEKLTQGTAAINMLIASETNYFLKCVADEQLKASIKFRVLMRVQDYLLAALRRIWKVTLKFERIYIDNLVIAEKSSQEGEVR